MIKLLHYNNVLIITTMSATEVKTVLCTDAKILGYVETSRKLMNTGPIAVKCRDVTEMKEMYFYVIVGNNEDIFISGDPKDAYEFNVSNVVAMLALRRAGKSYGIEECVRLSCSSLMKNITPDWSLVLLRGLEIKLYEADPLYARTILRFLHERGHKAEAIVARYDNVSNDLLLITYISGFEGKGNFTRSLAHTSTYAEKVTEVFQKLMRFIDEPNYSCRLDIGNKIPTFDTTEAIIARMRRVF